MNNIHMILDSQGTPLDISDYIMQATGIVEEPIYTSGSAGGTSKMGTPIYDRLQTLYRFTVPLKPNVQAVFAQIERKVRALDPWPSAWTTTCWLSILFPQRAQYVTLS